MKRYRNTVSSIVVEAIQLTEETEDEIERLVPDAAPITEIDRFTREEFRAFNIPTESGYFRLSRGMYLIKYAGGPRNFIAMQPGVFRRTYIPVEIPPGEVSRDVRDSKIMRSRTDQDET